MVKVEFALPSCHALLAFSYTVFTASASSTGPSAGGFCSQAPEGAEVPEVPKTSNGGTLFSHFRNKNAEATRRAWLGDRKVSA